MKIGIAVDEPGTVPSGTTVMYLFSTSIHRFHEVVAACASGTRTLRIDVKLEFIQFRGQIL